ncbi:thioredoxin family protein [Angustibacter peucedani]
MTTTGSPTDDLPAVVSREEWLVARRALLAKEKEMTRARDALNAERRRLPMVRVDEPYVFEGAEGSASLLDLFAGRRQLVVHHFMFGPDWDDGCPSCASAADGIGRLRQLHVRRTSLVAVSRAPYAKLAAFRERMGWDFPWYSSYGTSFNYDFHTTLDDRVAPVLLHFRTAAELAEAGTPWTGGPWESAMNGTEMPAISAFLRVDDEVFHTYSTYGRGIEEFHNAYPYLDLTALGRQEAWEEPAGRAAPLGLQVGGPAMRLPDEYEGDA